MSGRRLTAQLLAGEPATSAEAVAERLLAVQGQDARGVRLAVRARTRGLTSADVDHALTVDRSLVITWVNRGTLHLVRREDYPWLHALTTPPLLAANARRLAQEGVLAPAADLAVLAIDRALEVEGPLTRYQLRDRVAALGVRTEGQALVHLLYLASLRGLIIRGPMVGGLQAYARVRDWLGPQPHVQRSVALAELARRYLAGHGPADARDLARWSGLPLRDARSGLQSIAGQLAERPDGLLDLRGRDPASNASAPRLLGAFDPLLLGWSSRAAVLGAHQPLITSGGIFRPFVLVRGRAVGGWAYLRGRVAMTMFEEVARRQAAALHAEAGDVERFLQGGAGIAQTAPG